MKRSVVVWVAVLATGLVASAAERVVQCEEFTATSCGYCPYAGEAFGALLNSYPTTFAGIQIHLGDAYATSWGTARDTFYNVTGTPTAWFDGLISRVGGTSGMTYTSEYNTRHNIPSDIEMLVGAAEIDPPTSPPTYEVQIKLTLEPTGTAKTVRVYAAQVLDYYPTSPSYSRNCLRNATATEDVALQPGQTVLVTKTLQIDTASAANPNDMTLIAWAQAPNSSAPAEVYQAALMNYPFEALYAIKITLAEAVPEFIPPDEDTALTVRIQNGGEDLLPESALMHYRYDDGAFETAPLVPLGGEYFTATLPAPPCGTEPEFYFSAQGDGGSTVIYPENAPAEVVRTIVTTITTLMDDDFEEDLGWTVYNTPPLTEGFWQRAVPGGFGDHSPASDYDGSGHCYVTDNRYSKDVDRGPTILTSPVIDLSGMTDVYLRFARYIYCDDAGVGLPTDDDYLDLELSADGGTTWVLVEHVTGRGDWVYTQVRVLDFVELTSQFQMRFSLADEPANSVTEGGLDALWVFERGCSDSPHYGLGDLNCDGAVNVFDIDPFVLALTSGEGYYAVHPDCDAMLADANGDGAVNVFDIDPFVLLLTGGGK
jgi:hypothetical protein